MRNARFILLLAILTVGTALAESADPAAEPARHRNTLGGASQAPRRIVIQAAPAEEDEADTRALQEIAARAQKAIQSNDRDQLVLAILNLLPYYYEENAREGGSNENYDQILRELVSAGIIAGGPSSDPFTGLQTALDREGTAVFDSVGKKEKAEAPAPEKKRKTDVDYGNGAADASMAAASGAASPANSAATAPARVEEGGVAASSDAEAPVAVPAAKRRARAPRRNVATQLMASLLESLKAKNAADAAVVKTKAGAPPTMVAALKPQPAGVGIETSASAISPGIFSTLEKERHALLRDGLGWAGWGIVFLILILRQVRFMSSRQRRERVRRQSL